MYHYFPFIMILDRPPVRLRALLAGFVALSSAAIAQSPFWTPANGPHGGMVRGIVFDDQGNLYAGTAGSGIFRSTDNGDTWSAANSGLDNYHVSSDHFIWSLAAAPGGGLVAGALGTAYHSNDEGTSWDEITGNPGGMSFTAFVTARDGSLVGAAMEGPNGGMHRSTDGGATWVRTGLADKGISSLTITRQGSILAGCNDAKGIFRSTDNGVTWHAASLTDMQVHAMVVDSSGTITTSVIDGYYARSTDDGATWQKINFQNDFPRLATMAVAPNGDIYNSSGDGIYKASGWGTNWTRITSERFARYAEYMTFAPNGDLFVGSSRLGAYRYRPSTGEWKEINNGLTDRGGYLMPHPDGTVYAVGYHGMVYTSNNNGASWNIDPELMTQPIAIYPTGEIVAMGDRSKDGGTTWEPILLPEPFLNSTAIGRQGELYASFNHTVQVSRDTGLTWTPIYQSTHFVNSLVVDRHGAIVAGTYGVERSTDGGTTWVSSLPGQVVMSLAADSAGTLIAGTLSGIYRSTDNGATWTAGAAPNIQFTSLAVSRHGRIFAGSPDDGVYHSTDNGATWNALNGGLGNRMVISLAVDRDDKVYAGTEGGGVFVGNGGVAGAGRELEQSAGLALRSYPNPFGATTTLRFSLPHAADVSLTVTDLLGQPVATLAENEMEEGEHSFTWNPAGLPEGTYFCTLKAGPHRETVRVIRAR